MPRCQGQRNIVFSRFELAFPSEENYNLMLYKPMHSPDDKNGGVCPLLEVASGAHGQ